ncbi:MAG: hypothetical protein KDK78_06145, partial [Chlamydiia bacterium]|nr:hypothetical protein [Chlamydiia bacterium]
QDCWVELDALTQSVEARIRRRLKEQFGSNLGFDCAYEYPLFPDPSVCWMTMRFQTHPRKTDQVSAFILSEIERL